MQICKNAKLFVTSTAAEWDTLRRRFPDWQPEGVRYDKFRRHYLIAQQAAPLLPAR